MDTHRTLSLFGLLFLASCAHTIEYGPTGRIEDPAEILHLVRAGYDEVASLQTVGRLSMESPRGGGSLRIALDVDKPDRVFLESADFLGIGRGVFSTNGEQLTFYDPGEDVFYVGPATEELVGRFLPLALPPEEVVSLLLGQPTLLLDGEMSLEVEPEGVYRVEVRQGSVRQRIRVGTRDLRLISVETRGRPAVDVELSSHLESDGFWFPAAIELVERRSETTLRIRYSSPTLNGAIQDEVFELEPPPGAAVHVLH